MVVVLPFYDNTSRLIFFVKDFSTIICIVLLNFNQLSAWQARIIWRICPTHTLKDHVKFSIWNDAGAIAQINEFLNCIYFYILFPLLCMNIYVADCHTITSTYAYRFWKLYKCKTEEFGSILKSIHTMYMPIRVMFILALQHREYSIPS